ncbi:MAG TPA: type IV pilus assembly protein PilM [Actinomycetota bacterium]|nr:type IV pilus assembly protein PilM [Actinomycetota bacterium]
MGFLRVGGGHIGLDIGTSAVRAAEIRGDRSPQVVRFGQVLLPRGAVRNGEVEEPELVGQALTTLWKRAGFSSRDVRVGVSNRRVVVRQIEFPAMSREDLEGAIRFQAQDYIPIPLADAVMDFQVVDELTGPEGEALQRVVVVAAEREMVDRLVAAVQAAKLEPQSLELNAYPLVRTLGTDDASAVEAEAIVDIGAGVTNVVVQQAGKIRFVRTLSSGGDDFTQAVSAALDLEWEEAESMKHRASTELGIRLGADEYLDDDETQEISTTTRGAEPDDLEELDEDEEDVESGAEEEESEDDDIPESLSAAVDNLAPQVERFVEEVRGSLDFYTGQSEALPLRSVLVTGGGSLLGGLRSRLGAALRVPADQGSVFRKVPIGKVQLEAEQIAVAEPFLSVAVGLALGGFEA